MTTNNQLSRGPTAVAGQRTHSPSTPVMSSTGRLLAVDALRAVAALMVLLRHTGLDFHTDPLPLKALVPFANVGATGVGLFLVISGFSIHLRWAAQPDNNHQFSLRGFWARRFWRLYPTYYVAVAVSVLLLCVALGPERFFTEPSPWVIRSGGTPLWAQLLLTVTVVSGSVVPIKYMGVAWSLALEEHIYFVYALVLQFIRKLRPLRLLVLSFAVSIVWGIGVQAITRSVPPYQFLDQNDASLVARVFFAQLPARGFEWVLGLVAAEAFVGAVRLPRLLRSIGLSFVLIAVGGVLLRIPILGASLNGNRFFVSDVLLNQLFGLAFFIMLNAAVYWERTRAVGRRPTLHLLAGIGLASYSLYLLHPALLELLDPFVPSHGTGRVAGVAAMWLATLGASYVFYLAIERPFVARSRRAGRERLTGRHVRKRWRLLL